MSGIIIIGQYKAIIRDSSIFFDFFPEILRVIFQVFWSKSRVLGQIGRSGKVLGFISSNFGPDPTAGCLLQGNNRGAIIIIIIPDLVIVDKSSLLLPIQDARAFLLCFSFFSVVCDFLVVIVQVTALSGSTSSGTSSVACARRLPSSWLFFM